jgi:membrane fusion protein (multidrug efflux system)
MKTIHKIIIAVVICILGFVGFRYFYNRGTEQPFAIGARGPIPVEATYVKVQDMARRLRIAGTLVATQSVTLRPEVSGRIAEVIFDDGQEVKKGDPLYKIEDGLYKAKVDEARAKVELAKVEYDRAVSLLKKDFGTTQKRDQALSVLRINQAELDNAKLQLEHTTIRAPFDGTMGLSTYSVGAFVSEQVELVSIVDLNPINVDFTVPESFLGAFKVGDIVDVTVEGYDILPMDAPIKAISPEIDINTRTVMARAVMENPELALRPGQFARVMLNAGTAKDAVVIPEGAIESDSGEEFVMRIEEGVAIRTVIDTGFRDGLEVEVTNGLKPGDQIVVQGQFQLQDGQEVTVIDESTETQDLTEKSVQDESNDKNEQQE